ncbi:carboxyl transferase domain-containing protein [uncultured Corynebacterium sp.]|uniref:acyl-CoA carboxylase subunit beta n=1 Tax=uncultured Corynebacterium sp. TaxID=159447 RepID=UPI0026076E8D|nr:carboxyl transferase domain-containing protein [uncultured Corynebacterium sp.]
MATMSSTTDTSTTAGKIADLRDRLAETHKPQGDEIPRARRRVDALLDAGSFVETDALARHRSTAFKADKFRPVTDGIVAGYGTIDDRPVCVFSQDATLFDGQIGETAGEKILKVMELAVKSGTPLIGIYEGAGARPNEGIAALEFFSRIQSLQTKLSGVVPQIALVAGPTSGALVHSVVLSDVVVAVKGAGELVDDATDGTAHVVAEDDASALGLVADILGYLPSNNRALPLRGDETEAEAETDELDGLIPDADAQAYDMHEVLDRVVDAGSVLELQKFHAPNLITALARVGGRSVGVIANQPEHQAGAIDDAAAEKAARFIRFCDAFNVPLVTFVDSAGYAPDVLFRRTAKLIGVTAAASVGKIAVVTRKAFGDAYLSLGAKRLGTDLVYAWPTAQIAQDDSYQAEPYSAAERGLVDAVIPPRETRARIVDGLRLVERKAEDGYPRKHDNLPF